MLAFFHMVSALSRLQSTVFGTFGGKEVLVPVKTSSPISKRLMTKAMEEIQEVVLTAPVSMGDVILPDIAGSGISLVACKTFA